MPNPVEGLLEVYEDMVEFCLTTFNYRSMKKITCDKYYPTKFLTFLGGDLWTMNEIKVGQSDAHTKACLF